MNSLRPLAWPSLPSSTTTTRRATAAAASPLSTRLAAPLSNPGAVRYVQSRHHERPKPTPRPSQGVVPPPPPGLGEHIYIFNHIMANHIVYSLTPEMRANKAKKQFPYTGKKMVPAKLRKDYWTKFAVIAFGPGKGPVGRTVFRGLRELKKRHELEWEDPERLLKMSKKERGRALNDQRGNAVADIAALLAGAGKGNFMVVDDDVHNQEPKKEEDGKAGNGGKRKKQDKKAPLLEGDFETVEVKRPMQGEGAGEKTVRLHTATVYWANEQDKFYAQSWTENVTHVIGLPEKAGKAEAEEEAAAAEGQADNQAKQAEGEAKAAEQ